MDIARVFHIIFYFSGIISIMLGAYSLYIQPKSSLSRAFFGFTLSLGIWALGFSMAIDAETTKQCLFYQRVAAFGWSLLFAFLLHVCLIYTKGEKLLKMKWLYPLLYAPGVISVLVFSLLNSTAPYQYDLVRTSFGFTINPIMNEWILLYNIYYTVYILFGFALIWQYGRKSTSPRVKKQVRLILISYTIAFLLSSMIGILCRRLFSITLPQLGPILLLLPVITIYYSIFHFSLLVSPLPSETEVILTESTRRKVYSNLSRSMAAASALSYIVLYLHYKNVVSPIFPSLFILLSALLIQLLEKIPIRYGNGDYVKDIILIVLLFVTIPVITLVFIPIGSVTIWAASFLFIIVSMVFNKPIVLVSMAVSIVSTQILVWILTPEASIVVDVSSYVLRLGILLITIWFSYYVNKIYIRRLQKNARQLSLHQFVSEVSSDFINVNQTNIEDKMNWVIRILGKLFVIDRINILLIDLKAATMDYTNLWNVDREKTGTHYVRSVPMESVSWLMNQFIHSEAIVVKNIDELSDSAAGLRNDLKVLQIHSFVAIPIEEKANTIRIIEFSQLSPLSKWPDEELRVLNIIANLFDDALLKVEAEKEIFHMAYHDHLTGLPNRRLFQDRLTQAVALANRMEKIIGIIFINLDSFKNINDSLGHEGGDAILIELSRRLSSVVRQADTVSRFGGDEFLIMVNHLGHENDIHTIANKILTRLRQPLVREGQELYLTTSIGISLYPFDGTTMEELVKHAEIAMYSAKENGKNNYVLCYSELKEQVLQKIRITNSLHKALENNEFYLHYQPQVALLGDDGIDMDKDIIDRADGFVIANNNGNTTDNGNERSRCRIVGMEALLRWKHPELGFVSPAVFIPIAEQIGIINEIGEWVLRTACHQNKTWQQQGYAPVCIAINVSVNQLRSPNFADTIRQTLEDTGLDPHYLEVEITESAAMSETGDVIKFLNEVRSLGVKIAIDDFGTDYSSLSRLSELPIDKIKIDKQFVDSIQTGQKDQAIVRAIINLSKNLNLRVIAEGVECESQLGFLRQEQCDEVQGFYYYKPMPEVEIAQLLHQQHE